ncbi:MAG: FlgD immunoglobulin-like domain containing protein, partial [Candidatus Eisenbacteria bacterium]
VEGNNNKKTTFIFTATVIETPLRAYIDPPTRIDDSTYALYAKVWIHDIEVDHVDFQYFYDVDANGMPDDVGEAWWSISIDDNDDTTSADPGGDIILREGDGTLRLLDSLNGAWGNLYRDFPTGSGFVDYDGDGYSPRDPVIKGDLNGVFGAGDTLVIGEATVGDPITAFDAIEFYADVDSSGTLTADDWFFRQNMGGFLMDGPTDSLQLWMAMWNVAGLGSQYLVRAVATDELGNTDTSSAAVEIPYEVLALDTEAPVANISAIALGNGGAKVTGSAVEGLIVAGDNAFIKIWGESAAADLDKIMFEYSVTGGSTWVAIDVNDDNDFFVDIDGNIGFTTGDAILVDVYDDDTTFTVTGTDIALALGVAPSQSAMLGMRMYPLIGEDTVGAGDDEGDGQVDEDPMDADDDLSPFCVYLDIDALTAMGLFHTDTHVLLRATATDETGNTDPAPNFVDIYIQENVPPETDVIYAISNGDTIDVLPDVGGGSIAQLTAADTLFELFVTAEDTTTIDSVYLYYRMHNCYPNSSIFTNPWMRADVPADPVYPYNFDWDISAFMDGFYEFWLAGKDEELNETPPYEHPYQFGRLTTEAVIDTAARPLAKAAGDDHYTDTVLDEVTRDAELWIRAELTGSPNAMDPVYASVTFYYADRVLSELLTVRNFPPYISDAVAAGSINGDIESSVEVVIDTGSADVICTYHTNSEFDALASPTKYDYTINGTIVKFGAQLASTDSAYISYNYTSWGSIADTDNDVDENGYFTTAWDPQNPVPNPDTDLTDAFDLIAVVTYDVGGSCPDLAESQKSEHKIVLLRRTEGPEVTLHGFFWECCDAQTQYNYVGNPLTRSNDQHRKSKLCGIEYDVMVLVDSVTADSVKFELDESGTFYDLTHYVEGDTLALTITMNEEDFLFSDPYAIYGDSIENVQLLWLEGSDTYYTMYDDGAHNDGAANDGWWGVTVMIPVTSSTQHLYYMFDIDMSGDEHIVAWDPRNDASASSDTSKVVIPPDFWHTNLSASLFPDGAHTALAYAWGNDQVGTNASSQQGWNYFIIDCADPGITDLYVLTPIIGTGDCDSAYLVAVMEDDGDGIEDILELDLIDFQFATDDSKTRWVSLGSATSFDAENGYIYQGPWLSGYYPDDDNIDNDNDGETDESDEEDYTFFLRVVARDDTWNVTIREGGTIRIDRSPPAILLTAPDQGTVVAWGDTITVCAMPATSEDAVGLSYYKFFFSDSAGQLKIIDPTPLDDSDDPYVPADGENEVCIKFATNWLSLEEDQYIQFWASAVDSACNESDAEGPIVAAVNDTTGPSACVLVFSSDCFEDVSVADPHLAVSGDNVTITGKVIPNRPEAISIIEFWVQPVGGTAVLVDVTTYDVFDADGYFSIVWNADLFANEGETRDVDLWFVARDADNNPDPTPLKARVTVDRRNPAVTYSLVDLMDSELYWDDDDDPSGAPDNTPVIVTDPVTGDLTIQVYTSHSDVASMVLQNRRARDNWNDLGDWDNFEFYDDDAEIWLDYEPQHTMVQGGTTYYYWWYNIDADDVEDFSDALSDTIYEWRVLATDYACNDNALDPEIFVAAWDDTDPTCLFFGNDAIADGEIGQVTAGDDVTLNWLGTDNLTDVTHLVFWYVAPWSGDTIVIGSVNAVADSIDCPCNKWSAEIVWTTPEECCLDTDVNVYAWVYDTPGNRGVCSQTIRLEDKLPPQNTRLVDVSENDCTFPREVTETVLNNQTVYFAGGIVLHAVTAGCDSGVATVYFATVAGGDTVMIGAVDIDDGIVKTAFGEYSDGEYQIGWNTLSLDNYGQLLWPDGAYTVIVWAVDLENNVEIPTNSYSFVVDNLAPTVTVTSPGAAGTTVQVERGSEVRLTAVTPTTTEDVVVYWYIRNHGDADCFDGCLDCWTFMDSTNGYYGVDDTDENPDDNRPYSWEWASWMNDTPLEVGNKYDIIAIGEDLVCNGTDPCTEWLAGRGVTIEIFDNTAPCATITHLTRNVCQTGDDIEQPENERIRGFASLSAMIPNGDTDVEGARFEYSTDMENWIAADQDLVEYGDFWWYLNDWDSDQIAEGPVYWRVVAWDDVGNICPDPAVVTLIIDRTAPVVELVAPSSQTCPFVYDESGVHQVMPLIVMALNGVYDDIFRGTDQSGVVFEYKLTVEDTTAWRADSISNWLYDRGTGYYTATWNITDAGESSGKYDFRVTVSDSACNSATYNLATEIVVDIDAPDVNMTRVEVVRWNQDNEETTVVYPINNGVIVDVTQGEPITLFATVFDDEQNIPGSLETGIDSVFFEVAADSTGTVYHIDLGEPDEGDGIYSAQWNTTSLAAGDYFVRARAIDECKNVGVSPWTRIHVIDDAAPRAAVICWKPYVLNDINVTTNVTVYATKWCTQDVDEVMFQYRLHGSDIGDGGGDGFAGKVEADGWITFGMQRSSVYDDSLWYATMEIGPETYFQIGDTLDLRAVAITLKPSSGDNRDVLYFDQNPPIVTATIVANRFGRDLATVHPDGTPWLAFNLAELIPDFESNFQIEVKVSDQISEDWFSIAKPWVLVNAVRARDGWGFEEIVEMDPMNNGSDLDPYLWGGSTVNGLLDSIGCGGMVYINAAVVEDSGTVNDEDGYIQTDVIRKTIAVWEVTNGRGTNGWVSIPGYEYPTVQIRAGNGVNGGLLMTTTHTPVSSSWDDQRFFIRPIGQAYQLHLINCAGESCSSFNDGYPAKITFGYSDEDLTVTDWIGREVVVDELTGLLPAWWDGSHWVNYYTNDVVVDTAANTVTFYAEDLCGNYTWSLVGITGGSQMNIYPWCDGYTSESPTFVGTITDFMAEATIDFPDIEIWIDNQLVASADDDVEDRSDLDDHYDDPDLPDIYGFAVGNGFFRLEVVEDEEYSVTFRYHHSTLTADRLSGGKHEIVVIYRNEDEDYYFNLRREFMVDVVPVQVAWSGGFLNGPCVGGVDCYVGGDKHALTVQLTDLEAGVLTEESRIEAVLNLIYGTLPEFIGGSAWGWIDTTGTQGLGGLGITFGADTFIPLQDMGLKMDVWLVDNEDDQTDIDEYAERMLIQAGTPAMLTFTPPMCPYSDASRCDDETYYDPSDNLMVTLPLTADLAKYNGREIEVVLYSSKLEHIGFDSNIGQLVGLGGGGGGEDDDEEFTKYVFGPFDCVGNVGSQFVARRFIIDASAPRIVFLSPVMRSVVAPNSEIPVVAVVVDSSGASSAGSGIDYEALMVSLNGPDGQVFSFYPATFDPADTASTDDATAEAAQNVVDHVKDWNIEGDKITMTLMGLGKAGTYNLVMEGSDVIGNEFVASHTFTAGSSVLQITDAYVFPNPVDPQENRANIRFNLGGTRDARVTVKVFDFAGDLVYAMPTTTEKPGLVELEWSGSTNGGTMVANGGYLAHISVDDGAGVKTASVKIAVRKN